MKGDKKMNNILVVGAHYDDAELGVGGTMAKLARSGKKVYKITLTDTEVFSEMMNLKIAGSDAKANSLNASKIIGSTELEFDVSVYGNLKYTQSIMQKLEEIVLRYDIDTCFFHFYDDYNTDHIAANQICKTAFRHCNNLLMFQSNPYITTKPYVPDFFVDISDSIQIKKEALLAYDKEHNRQGRLFETNIERNHLWGYGNHVEYAEGFKIIKYFVD